MRALPLLKSLVSLLFCQFIYFDTYNYTFYFHKIWSFYENSESLDLINYSFNTFVSFLCFSSLLENLPVWKYLCYLCWIRSLNWYYWQFYFTLLMWSSFCLSTLFKPKDILSKYIVVLYPLLCAIDVVFFSKFVHNTGLKYQYESEQSLMHPPFYFDK